MLGLVDTGYIVKGNFFSVLREEFSSALSKGEGLVTPHLHLPHKKDPEGNEKDHRPPGEQEGNIPGVFIRRSCRNPHIMITERLYQFRVICRVGSELLSILEGSADMVLLDDDIAHLSLFKL